MDAENVEMSAPNSNAKRREAKVLVNDETTRDAPTPDGDELRQTTEEHPETGCRQSIIKEIEEEMKDSAET
ncbi:hypothetical protein HPB50_002751 [Hyalomma asiaticum]|uniref:Uncharacterized protein n=1 Tax=Hyalomma asiaticum TaxID=266040 RepID=A0ACB7TE25_HYAAI|nr:hypothetical protein HPB50_002751 [Hyalomma asiaticum]